MPKSKHNRKGKRRQSGNSQGLRTHTLSGKARPERSHDDYGIGGSALDGIFGIAPQAYSAAARLNPAELYRQLTGDGADKEPRYCYQCDSTHPRGVTRLEWQSWANEIIMSQINPDRLSECGPTGHQQAAWGRLMLAYEGDPCRVCGKEMQIEIVPATEREIVTDHAVEKLDRPGGTVRLDHHVRAAIIADEITAVSWISQAVDENIQALEAQI